MVVLGCWDFFVGLVNFYFRHGTLSDEMWCESSVTYFDKLNKENPTRNCRIRKLGSIFVQRNFGIS